MNRKPLSLNPVVVAMRISLLIVVCAGALACGSVSTNPPTCTGTSCACAAGASCDVSTQTCGGSCTLACAMQSKCAGSCGDSCSVDCGEQATCAITIGPSGSVSCKTGSTCNVTCVGGC